MKEEIQQTDLYKKNLLQYLLTNKKQLKAKKSLAKQRGFDLVQLGVVVALIGVLMAGAFVGVPAIMSNIRANGEVTDIQTAVSNAQRVYSGTGATTGLSTANAAKLGLYALDRINGDKITNRFNGEVEFKPNDVIPAVTASTGLAPGAPGYTAGSPEIPGGNAIVMTSKNYPGVACSKVIPVVSNLFHSIKVGKTEVKKAGGFVDVATLATACPMASTSLDLEFTMLK